MTRRVLMAAACAALVASAAHAQLPTGDSARAGQPPHQLPIDPGRVHPERLSYRLTIVRDTTPPAIAGAPSVTARDTTAGIPAVATDTGFVFTSGRDGTMRVRGAGGIPPTRAIPDASVRAPVVIDTNSRAPVAPAVPIARDTAVRTAAPLDSGGRAAGGTRVEVAASTYGGAPAWLLTRTGTLGLQSVAESLYVARADLRPLHWSAALGLARLAAEFTPDSIYAGMSSPLGKQSIVLGNRRDLLPSVGAMDVVLGTLPLAAGWQDSATVFLADPGGSTLVPVTLSVAGEESVTVATGTFDCWVVSVESERASERLWVRKSDGVVVRSRQPLPQMGADMVLERVLAGP